MACRIGMTTNPEQRKAQWLTKYPSLVNWKILKGPIEDKATAQVEEAYISQLLDCESSPGGDDPDDPFAQWYIYRFEY
ncbi:MAG: hypothetical protein KAS53_00670 [Candidatus Cloacimonetes bacterium]|nr:hypothetical protein [Candidatus Cloacimonadota bacterium]